MVPDAGAPLMDDVRQALLGRLEKMTGRPAGTEVLDTWSSPKRSYRCTRCRQFDLGLYTFIFPGDFADAFTDPKGAGVELDRLRKVAGRHRIDLCQACIAAINGDA